MLILDSGKELDIPSVLVHVDSLLNLMSLFIGYTVSLSTGLFCSISHLIQDEFNVGFLKI